MTEIHHADPGARRRALILIAAATVAGMLLLLLMRSLAPAVEVWLTEDLSQAAPRLRLLIYGIAVALGFPTLLVAVTVWQIGARIVAAGRYPTPDMRVVRDVHVVQGPRARVLGRLLQLLGVIPVVALVVLIAFLWRLTTMVDSRT